MKPDQWTKALLDQVPIYDKAILEDCRRKAVIAALEASEDVWNEVPHPKFLLVMDRYFRGFKKK